MRKMRFVLYKWYFAGPLSLEDTYDNYTALRDIFVKKAYKPAYAPQYILDLGANIGIATYYFASRYPNARIDAYEPNPQIFQKLVENMRRFKNVRCFNEAVGGTPGKLAFFVSDRSFSSSFYAVPQSHEISVEVSTLDTAIERLDGEDILLKIDIEGAEYDALQNATELKRIKEIVGEVHPEKAGRHNDELRHTLSAFTITALSQAKGELHALRG